MSDPQSTFSTHAAGLGWVAPNPVRCELRTARLTIRPYRLDEANLVNTVVQDSREHLLPWMPWARSGHDEVAGTAKYIAEQILALNAGPGFEGIGVAIFDTATQEFLGGTGIHDVRADTASCETGYWLRADRCGRGYATEACGAIISWAMADPSDGGLGLRRVRIWCSAANEPSSRIPERLGLRLEARQRDECYVEGYGPTDRLGWGVLAHEWDFARHRALTNAGT